MKKGLVICFCLFSFFIPALCQNPRYVIALKHKGATGFSLSQPSGFLSSRAIDRRERYGIAVDSLDLPVPSIWIRQIESIPNVTVLNTSRWLNMISVRIDNPAALQQLNELSFVLSSTSIAARPQASPNKTEEKFTDVKTARGTGQDDYYNYGTTSLAEIRLHHGDFLHNAGLRGQGMQIAVLDGGFYQYTTLKAFDSVNANGQVLDTWDFVEGNSSVTEDIAHGMQCFSTMAANIPGVFTGKSPAASFYLFRTEDAATEFPIEEFNWACAAERSDSTGADLISSSLGYGYGFSGGFADYPYSDLNGDITLSARAADIAAAKGLLVVNAAGNSGNDYWKMITTPADADSVLAVGAVSISGTVGSFSSYGPSADGRVKPDVASVGVQALIQSASNTIVASNGTSYACPNMAGLAACLWQAFPEVNNMRIIRALREAGSIAQTPDNRIGFGIPDLRKAFITLLREYATSSLTAGDCKATLRWNTKDFSAMRFEVDRKTAADADFHKVADIAALPGDVLANHSYEWINDLTDQPAGSVSYRIRQIADTANAGAGSLILGNTLVTSLTTVCPAASMEQMIRLAPNPVTGSAATIIFNNAETIESLNIRVFAMNGAKLLEFSGSKTTGLYRKDINISGLASGKYVIRITTGKREIAKLDLLRL